jgi:hypothetical protein
MNAASRTRVPRLARLLVLVGLLTALATITAGSASAIGNLGQSFPPPNGLNGWYISSPVSGTFRFDVDGPFVGPLPITPASYDERMSAACIRLQDEASVGVVPTTFGSPGGFVDVDVDVFGDSPSPAGWAISCTATYERRDAECSFVFGIPFCTLEPTFGFFGTVEATRIVKIDTSPPVDVHAGVAPPNGSNGWYSSPTPVDWLGSDPNSGVNFCQSGEPFGDGGPGQQIGPPDGTSKTIVGGCQNEAGRNTVTGVTYKFDGTAPTLAPVVSPNPVGLNAVATVAPNADDNLSEIDTVSCDPVDTSAVGTHTIGCTATDEAGNSATAATSYQVGYTFDGFFQPVDMTKINGANAGQTIPLKFRVTDGNGDPVTDLTSVSVTATSLACDLGVTSDQIEEYAAGNSGLHNQGDGNYQFNWKTPKAYANSCKTLSVDLGDGIDRTATFRFAK